ncbi:MAG TPA: hypothetical protein VNA29_05195 [Sphingomicrobium sp.]|nr:hypothetical protein [Sphingomicrobium sp.]
MTGVQLAVLEELTSKTIATGAPVRMALSYPLHIRGQLGLPAGTPVEGVVIHAAKGGFGGKPGELVLAAKRIMLTDGSSIPLRSFKLVPQKGKDNQALAMGMVVAGGAIGGVAAMFITGGSARVAPGAYGTAKTSADTALASSSLSTLPAISTLVLPEPAPSAATPAVPATATPISNSSDYKGN